MRSATLTRRAFLTTFRRPRPAAPVMSTTPTLSASGSTPPAPSSPLQLPTLQQTLLDVATDDALFRDLAAFAKVPAVRPKYAPGTHAPAESLTLDQARVRLASGLLLGVQIRYAYDGHEWCDTLLRRPAGLTLVRIRETDITASVAASAA